MDVVVVDLAVCDLDLVVCGCGTWSYKTVFVTSRHISTKE